MGVWWNGLTTVQQIFAGAAIPATVILILQTILMLFGLGQNEDFDTGADAHGDVNVDTDGDAPSGYPQDVLGLRIFTIRGIIAFFSIGGWCGIFFVDIGASEVLAVLGAVLAGSIAALLIALFMKMAYKLQEEGNIQIKNAVGKDASVYLTIPASMERTGKVTLELQGRHVELEALTKSENPIRTGKQVKVTEIINNNTLLVEEIAIKE